MAHTIGKYGDIGNFSGVTYIILPFVSLKFVGTQAPTAKIIGDIPDFNVLNVPKTQPRHNPASHYIEPKLTYVIQLRAISLEKFNLSITKIYLKLAVLNYSHMTCSPGSKELNHLSIVLSGAWNEWTPVWLGGWPFYLIPHCMVGRFDKVVIKTSTPKQNGRHFMHFAGNIFKHTFFKILVFWFKFHRSSFKTALVQVMAWCRQATSHYLTQCQPIHMLPYGVIRPQWVKVYFIWVVVAFQLPQLVALFSSSNDNRSSMLINWGWLMMYWLSIIINYMDAVQCPRIKFIAYMYQGDCWNDWT